MRTPGLVTRRSDEPDAQRPAEPLAPGEPLHKVVTLDELLARRRELAARGKRLVHCHGCFDIVHPGHIRHLRFARSQGEALLVSITGDQGISKGSGRPLIPQELRAENLAALDCVDLVYIEPRPTAVELLDAVRPDVYIKGKEYESNRDPRFQSEREAVERHGGRVVFSSGDVVFSSSALIGALSEQGLAEGSDPAQRRLAQLIATDELDAARLDAMLARAVRRRCVVIGEVRAESYIACERPELSSEAPVLSLVPTQEREFLGGAAAVALQAASMGADVTLVTALPHDQSAGVDTLRRTLTEAGVRIASVISDTPLARRERYLSGGQKLACIDRRRPLVLDVRRQAELVGLASDSVGGPSGGGADAVLLVDSSLGLFTPMLCERLCTDVRRRAGVLAAASLSGQSHLRSMQRLDLLCASEEELRQHERGRDDALPAVVWRVLEHTRSAAALVSLGSDGLIGFSRLPASTDGWPTRLRGDHVPSLAPYGLDLLGCDETAAALAALVLAVGGSMLGASFCTAAATAVQARRIGLQPVTPAELRRELRRVQSSHLTITRPSELAQSAPRPLVDVTTHAALREAV